MQGFDAVSCGGLVESIAVTLGHDDVGMVQEPVDGGGGQGLGHEVVEARRVQVRADREAAPLVGCVDEAVEAFGGVRRDR